MKTCYFKQNYTLKLFIAFKMACSFCFSLEGNQHLIDFLQKSYLTSTAASRQTTHDHQEVVGLYPYNVM